MFNYDLTGVSHNAILEDIVDVLCRATRNEDRHYFRVQTAYFLAKAASNMRVSIRAENFQGLIPINLYAINLANSGYGKGHSTNILEKRIFEPFRKRLMDDTFGLIAEDNAWKIAIDRANRFGTDPNEEAEKVKKESNSYGMPRFTFDAASSPAIKQLRSKFLISGIGALSLQVDEIGLNLAGSAEALGLYLELFDVGEAKEKLTKSSVDNKRSEELIGCSPANALLFGTPSRLLDGGITEDLFYSFLDSGYARRCFFGLGAVTYIEDENMLDLDKAALELYQKQVDPTNNAIIKRLSLQFEKLADPMYHKKELLVPEVVAVELLKYQLICDHIAAKLPEHQSIKKNEIKHRYFKAMKLAGAYAFAEEAPEITLDHLRSAILLAEESGQNFESIMNREKPYERLAKHISTVGRPVTHADLLEDLPFYKSGVGARNEMMTLAIAWGRPRHIIIKKTFTDNIEFFEGERLEETDLSKMTFSVSGDWAYHYEAMSQPFDKLHKMTQAEDLHWSNHAFKNMHRAEENVIPGFNMVVLDVDNGFPLETAIDLLSEYKFLAHTTKRSTPDHNRYRILLPINYRLKLDSKEYKEFMNQIVAFMPFAIDESVNQRAKKWQTFDGGEYHYNHDGQLFDALPFIPRTATNDAHRQQNKELESLDNLERWFAGRMAEGNRNNHMIKYAFALVDSGWSLLDVTNQVYAFNKKLSNPLSEDEINKTVLVTVSKRFQKS